MGKVFKAARARRRFIGDFARLQHSFRAGGERRDRMQLNGGRSGWRRLLHATAAARWRSRGLADVMPWMVAGRKGGKERRLQGETTTGEDKEGMLLLRGLHASSLLFFPSAWLAGCYNFLFSSSSPPLDSSSDLFISLVLLTAVRCSLLYHADERGRDGKCCRCCVPYTDIRGGVGGGLIDRARHSRTYLRSWENPVAYC